MKHMNRKTLSLQLTLLLDGRLDDDARSDIERLIESDARIRAEYEQLRRMRALLAAREPIPADPWMPERIMNRIRRSQEDDAPLLPVPRRFRPVTATVLGVMLVAVIAFAWVQREHILRYVGDTGTQMQQAYEETILKGWIMPLFQRTNQDQVLEFAMFGTLPLDSEDGTVLRVDEHADQGYRVELANNTTPPRAAATIDDLYREIRPTAAQRKVFDTLFFYAQRQLESSVLMNEEREIAVNPSIGKFNTVILSGIASNLEPEQLVRFERFLDDRDAPYTLVSRRESPAIPPPPPPQRVLERIRTVRAGSAYVVLNEDSYTVVRLSLDMDSLRRLMMEREQRVPRLEFRVQEFAERYARRPSTGIPATPLPPRGVSVSPVPVSDGGHAIAISVAAEDDLMREVEREFQELREQIVVIRRESDALRSHAFIRIEENLRRTGQLREGDDPAARSRGGRSPRAAHRIDVTVQTDSARVIHMQIDTTLLMPDGSLREMRFEMQDLLRDLPKDGQFRWQEYISPGEKERIDSLLQDTHIETMLSKEQLEQLRLELLLEKREAERQRDGSGSGIELIAPVPPARPARPRAPEPARKDSSIEI